MMCSAFFKLSVFALVSPLLLGISDCQNTYNRTVILFYYESATGEYVFLRGGISSEHRDDCTETASDDPCAIGIYTRLLGTIDTYDSYNYWRVDDNFLDWHGAEPNQGLYDGVPAEGTPTAWTTNNSYSPAYQKLNKYGDSYWMVDMNMNCSETDEGWFEFKAFVDYDWEEDLRPGSECSGTVGGIPPYQSTNHLGRCGYVNVARFEESSCIIDLIEE